VRVLSTRRVYEGKVLSLDVDEVLEPEGVRATREVVRHRGSVAALPVHEDGRMVLVRQYRYAVDALVWELPAGRLDPGETVEDAARREMEEEVGLRPRGLGPLPEGPAAQQPECPTVQGVDRSTCAQSRRSRLTTIASWVVRAMTTTASVPGSGFSSRCGTNGGTKT